jgi:hypothetical protein
MKIKLSYPIVLFSSMLFITISISWTMQNIDPLGYNQLSIWSNINFKNGYNWYGAGVVPYYIHKGITYFLLGLEPDFDAIKYKGGQFHYVWDDFGGSRDKTDKNIAETAIREANEETRYFFSNDLSLNAYGYFAQGKYAQNNNDLGYGTFLIPISSMDISGLIKGTFGYHAEKVAFIWVNAAHFMKTIDNKYTIYTWKYIQNSPRTVIFDANNINNNYDSALIKKTIGWTLTNQDLPSNYAPEEITMHIRERFAQSLRAIPQAIRKALNF